MHLTSVFEAIKLMDGAGIISKESILIKDLKNIRIKRLEKVH